MDKFGYRAGAAQGPLALLLLALLSLAAGIYPGFIAESYDSSWDAYAHLFFADHYRRDWFGLHEPRWFGGFSVAAYPPLAHQLLALGAELLDSPERSLQLFTLLLHPLFVFGCYRWSRIFLTDQQAYLAALLAILIPAFYVLTYAFGQIPFIFSLSLCLHAAASLYHYARRESSLLEAVAALASAACSHHAAPLFFLPALTLTLLPKLSVRQTLRLICGAAAAAAVTSIALAAMIDWLIYEQSAQAEIPHASRENIFTSDWQPLLFFWPMYGIYLPLLAIAATALLRRARIDLFVAAVLSVGMFLLGLGGTTPLPSLVLGGHWRWMTYDRFQIMALVLMLPPLIGVLGAVTPRLLPALRQSAVAVFTAFAIAGAAYSANLSKLVATQPPQVDLEPILNFLAQDDHAEWRFLTFGFGERSAKLVYESSAGSLDGQYYTARTLPELTSSGLSTIDRAFLSEATEPFLKFPERYALRWIILAPNVAEHYSALLEGYWKQQTKLANGVVVLEPVAKLIPKVTLLKEQPGLKNLLWGLLPLLIFTTAVIISVLGRRSLRPAGDPHLIAPYRLAWPVAVAMALGIVMAIAVHGVAQRRQITAPDERGADWIRTSSILKEIWRHLSRVGREQPIEKHRSPVPEELPQPPLQTTVDVTPLPLCPLKDTLDYVYGGAQVTELSGTPDCSLRITLSAQRYSGVAIKFAPRSILYLRRSGGVALKLRGQSGGERFLLKLGSFDRNRIVASEQWLPRRFGLSSASEEIKFPLRRFPDRGWSWNGSGVSPALMKWSNLAQIEFAGTPEMKNESVFVLESAVIEAHPGVQDGRQSGSEGGHAP